MAFALMVVVDEAAALVEVEVYLVGRWIVAHCMNCEASLGWAVLDAFGTAFVDSSVVNILD